MHFEPQNFEIVGVALGMTGQVFIANQRVQGFYIWVASNICLATSFYSKGLVYATLWCGVNILVCFYSVWRWSRPADARSSTA